MNRVVGRLHDAFSKLTFCVRHAATPGTLLRLLVNTKRLHHYMKSNAPVVMQEKPRSFIFKFKGQRHQLFLRTYSGDLQIFYEVFWRRAYDIYKFDPGTCKTIVDLGGNVGMSALFFTLQAPQAALWVLEPDPESFYLLRKNLSGVNQSCILLQAAAASSSGTLFLEQSRYAYNSSTRNFGKGKPVQAIAMNDLLNQYGIDSIDLLKIDIEGFEVNLFSCNTEWLQKVKHLSIEIHTPEAYTICNNALSGYDFTLHCVSGCMGDAGIYYALRAPIG